MHFDLRKIQHDGVELGCVYPLGSAKVDTCNALSTMNDRTLSVSAYVVLAALEHQPARERDAYMPKTCACRVPRSD